MLTALASVINLAAVSLERSIYYFNAKKTKTRLEYKSYFDIKRLYNSICLLKVFFHRRHLQPVIMKSFLSARMSWGLWTKGGFQPFTSKKSAKNLSDFPNIPQTISKLFISGVYVEVRSKEIV